MIRHDHERNMNFSQGEMLCIYKDGNNRLEKHNVAFFWLH